MRNGFRIWFPLFLALLAVPGCRRNDLVENELRARDIQYREALEELNRTEGLNDGLRRENDSLRAGSKVTPEQAAQTFGVRKITLGRGTSGVDNDKVPGDEVLQVWLEPRDTDDHTIKAPGSVQICVLEINAQGQKVPLSCWDIDSEKLRQSWKQGLLSVGYVLTLPWKTPPRVENIRVTAKLTLPDGRVYETDKDIKVRLMPGAAARAETLPAETPQFKATPTGAANDGGSFFPAGRWNPTGNAVQQVGHWQAPPLQDAVSLGRPLPLPERATSFDLLSSQIVPILGEIRVND